TRHQRPWDCRADATECDRLCTVSENCRFAIYRAEAGSPGEAVEDVLDGSFRCCPDADESCRSGPGPVSVADEVQARDASRGSPIQIDCPVCFPQVERA